MKKQKAIKQHAKRESLDKKGSTKPPFQGNLAYGLNRRAFLKTGGASIALAQLAACTASEKTLPNVNNETPKVNIAAPKIPDIEDNAAASPFDPKQKAILKAVQQHLFPDDGDGPEAESLNAFSYLEFAMTDPVNIKDGDPSFIADGAGWLEDLALQSQGDNFLKLDSKKQSILLDKIAQSSAGENWLSILLYYLTEALTLDPVYGGNKNGVGWQWLEHQAGFPRPVKGKTYRDFE